MYGWASSPPATIEAGCVNGNYSEIDPVVWLDNSNRGAGAISIVLHVRDEQIHVEGESDLLHSR